MKNSPLSLKCKPVTGPLLTLSTTTLKVLFKDLDFTSITSPSTYPGASFVDVKPDKDRNGCTSIKILLLFWSVILYIWVVSGVKAKFNCTLITKALSLSPVLPNILPLKTVEHLNQYQNNQHCDLKLLKKNLKRLYYYYSLQL